MDEYVFVRFVRDGRTVLLDDRPGGRTNEIFIVNTGTHLFSLDGPQDFAPAEKIVVVENTSADNPLTVRFRRKAGPSSTASG